MTAQAQLNFDRKLPPNPYRVGTGNWRVYAWLELFGKITLHELHHTLNCDTARIRTDVKAYLRLHEMDIECVHIRPGLTEYRVV